MDIICTKICWLCVLNQLKPSWCTNWFPLSPHIFSITLLSNGPSKHDTGGGGDYCHVGHNRGANIGERQVILDKINLKVRFLLKFGHLHWTGHLADCVAWGQAACRFERRPVSAWLDSPIIKWRWLSWSNTPNPAWKTLNQCWINVVPAT